jgi:hypothetical protein
MTLSKVQPFLDEAFEFLRDREFTISREDWARFCDSQGMSLEKLKSAKSELLRQSQKVDDDSERLKQIFCCDPFDAGSTKALRDIWHDKAESQPDPFQRWFSDLSIHLLDLDSSSETPSKQQNSTSVEPIPQSSNLPPEQNKLPKELFSAIITGSIIGIFMLIGLVINNYLNNPKIIIQKEQIISTPSTFLMPTTQDSIETDSTSSQPIINKPEINTLDKQNFRQTKF